ncbi:MAG: hypothetical protein F6J86_19420 [Symploca sp. SIO1B1]|nr:hypothetical protein [Symploca sp. SIO1B1]
MIDPNIIFEFSRTNCVAICAFLVPANLLLTLQTLVFAGFSRPQAQVRNSALVAFIPALLIILHVCTWLMIGVVMAPTFILLCLGGTCLVINSWAMFYASAIAKQCQIGQLSKLSTIMRVSIARGLNWFRRVGESY